MKLENKFIKRLKQKGIEAKFDEKKGFNDPFIETMFTFYKMGWEDREKRTEISIEMYHRKFVSQLVK